MAYLEERDANGNFSKAFYDSHDSIVTVTHNEHSRDGRRSQSGSRVIHLIQFLVTVFLPTGYPDSVTRDYIDYQIYDSVQAFSSSISSLIGSRAVLTAVGVGDAAATGTSAMFITVVQATLGRLGTILFAWKFGSVLELECKKYRFGADLVNNAGIVCDCLSPYFADRKSVMILFLCCSGVLKAICGVMANGSRAALTMHFTDAQKGSISDVSAKDASQETVISLLGMLAGTLIIPYLESTTQVWTALTFLIVVHLWTNYLAVRSVVMDTLNRQRTSIVFAHVMDHMSPALLHSDFLHKPSVPVLAILSTHQVATREHVLQQDGALQWGATGPVMGTATFGSFAMVARWLPSTMSVHDLLSIFTDTGYVLWYTTTRVRGQKHQHVTVNIALLDYTDDSRDIRAWVHALIIARSLRSTTQSTAHDTILHTLALVTALFESGNATTALTSKGWHISPGRTMIVSGSVPRVRVVNT
ncbi:vitamin B6 photo-protection and homoeostasis-domain-containing protein [Lipomyces arxii]|uniref:vitamin B6 photo-protection and homoeostasis-domain-containing protein n=1 Tax=Lipomyces arxii TaxID=56418 RepID=UPI0034CD22FB